MAKLAQDFAKYVIYAKLESKGVIEKPDVIGAIFGQTEGLLGQELDLRELQRTGRIGRIEANIQNNKGMCSATIIIPSSLDAAETSIIAASLETIDKVGPCDAKITVEKVDDVRSQKRRFVVDRAKELLKGMSVEKLNIQKVSENIKESIRAQEVMTWQGLACGPAVIDSEEIIVVEGRADVINLLRNGINNAIAMEGSKIPEEARALTKQRTTTAFLDNDRGGDLDLKKLLEVAEIDFIARAEPGFEVEELSQKQIFKALRERVPTNQYMERAANERSSRHTPNIPEVQQEDLDGSKKKLLETMLMDLIGTHAAYILDTNLSIVSKIPINELHAIEHSAHAVILDAKVNQDLVDFAVNRKIHWLVGMGLKEHVKGPVNVLTIKDLR